ncbi:uncharacterized protein LOC122132774, partial [Clupea harengus]|uniref:Uncharacterized protein LOC122132774 n=1 Tax=Clupea harengus TaxID=7950 RepID=A0A8M1KHB5_CLUHA
GGTKRSFLRKGEGLGRFNPSARNHTEPHRTKNRTRPRTKQRDLLRQNHTELTTDSTLTNPTETKAGVPTRPNQNRTEPLIGPNRKAEAVASRVQRKTATLRERRREHSELGEFELLEAAAEEVSLSSCSSSFLQDVDDDDEMTPVAPSSHCLPVTPPPYDSCPYQEPEGAGQGEGPEGLSDMVEVEFDDDDTWADTSQHALQPERTLKRKVAVAKGAESFQADEDREAPPTSQLIAKLFPALQPKPLPPRVTQTSPQPISSQESEGVCEVMRERLVQLELEIERFRMERADLARLKTSLYSQQEEL